MRFTTCALGSFLIFTSASVATEDLSSAISQSLASKQAEVLRDRLISIKASFVIMREAFQRNASTLISSIKSESVISIKIERSFQRLKLIKRNINPILESLQKEKEVFEDGYAQGGNIEILTKEFDGKIKELQLIKDEIDLLYQKTEDVFNGMPKATCKR